MKGHKHERTTYRRVDQKQHQQHWAFIGHYKEQLSQNNYKATHQHNYSLNTGTFLLFAFFPINMLLAITGQRRIQHWCSIQQSESSLFSSIFGLHHLLTMFFPLRLNSWSLNTVFSFFNWEVTANSFYAQWLQSDTTKQLQTKLFMHKIIWFSTDVKHC